MQTQEQVGFYQVIQQRVDGYLKHINLTSREVIEYVTIFGLGFLIGILLKRYGTIIVSAIIGVVFFITLLNYFDFITINTSNIKIFLNMQQVHSFDDFFVEIKLRIGNRLIECLIALCSIVLGFKLG
jgi:uncharacterized membrane protein (Fun14 family)